MTRDERPRLSSPWLPDNGIEKDTLITRPRIVELDPGRLIDREEDDLSGDGGCIRTVLREGTGWRKPKHGDEVLISYRVAGAGGAELPCEGPRSKSLEYRVGSEVLGPLTSAVEAALGDMRRREVVRLKCSDYYAEGWTGIAEGEAAELELELAEIYKTEDISATGDASTVKKRVRDGEARGRPGEASRAELRVASATDGEAALPGFVGPRTLEFTVGDGEVCEALDRAVVSMKMGERAVVTCLKPELCRGPELGLVEVGTPKVIFTVELVSFEPPSVSQRSSEAEKLVFGAARKEVGGALFKQGRYGMALGRYKNVIELLDTIDGYGDESKAMAQSLRQMCELNKAACLLKLGSFVAAKLACDVVLKHDAGNLKALFRRATAYFNCEEFPEAQMDLERLLELDSANADAKRLLPQVKQARRQEGRRLKEISSKMVRGDAQARKFASSPATDGCCSGFSRLLRRA